MRCGRDKSVADVTTTLYRIWRQKKSWVVYAIYYFNTFRCKQFKNPITDGNALFIDRKILPQSVLRTWQKLASHKSINSNSRKTLKSSMHINSRFILKVWVVMDNTDRLMQCFHGSCKFIKLNFFPKIKRWTSDLKDPGSNLG